VTHDEFKQLSKGARAIVRTGECSPYANIILVAGVVF
jgi:D-ribose pyranase